MGLRRVLTELIKYKQILFLHFTALLLFPGWKEEGDKASFILLFVCVSVLCRVIFKNLSC